ncbi:MAG: hypothetical protein A2Z30_07695 [Chloroflexi bacterium RBG_16_64_43]|nr:MAG: hypothetical protein A2Z30_07695 [Chloroflexi bacterium RBG_16_64_43]
MAEQLRMTTVINASPRKVYAAWLDPREHSAFTGSKATGGSKVGDPFTAWDGYILGVHLELEPGRRIVQAWRTSDFPPGSEDSRLEIVLAEVAGKTRLVLTQSNIPDGQAEQYREGWDDFYFAPLAKYVAERPARKSPAAARPRVARGAGAKSKAKPPASRRARPKPKAKPRAVKAARGKTAARKRTRRRA